MGEKLEMIFVLDKNNYNHPYLFARFWYCHTCFLVQYSFWEPLFTLLPICTHLVIFLVQGVHDISWRVPDLW